MKIQYVTLLCNCIWYSLASMGVSPVSTAIINKPLHLPLKSLPRTEIIFKHDRNEQHRTNKHYLQRRSNDTDIPLYNDFGQIYLAEISVGTPPQNFTVIVDTQSSDFWIPSYKCDTTMCLNHTFDPTASSTFHPFNTTIPFGYYYGANSINGSYAQDDVTIGGLTVHNQTFVLASQVDPTIIARDDKQRQKYKGKASVEGVLGLGFPNMIQSSEIKENQHDPPLLLHRLANEKLIPERVFSIATFATTRNLAVVGKSLEGWTGELTLGGVNSERFQGEIMYAEVPPVSLDRNITTPPEYALWLIQTTLLSVFDNAMDGNLGRNSSGSNSSETDSTLLSLNLPVAKYTMVDTGTSMSYVGSHYAKQMLRAILENDDELDSDSSTGCYLVDCGLIHSEKHIGIDIIQSQENVDHSQQAFQTGALSNQTATATTDTKKFRVKIPVKNLIQPQHVGDYITGEDDTCIFSLCSWPPMSTEEEGDVEIEEKPDVPLFIFGESILRSLYLVFDSERYQIGLASPTGSNTTVSHA